jgi:hypothetical protein
VEKRREKKSMCALRAVRPQNQGTAPVNQAPVNQAPVNQAPVNQAPVQNAPAVRQQANVAAAPEGSIENLNAGILDNIDGLGNGGNFVTMDGSEFLYKATDERLKEIDLIVNYGKRYYQWVEEDGESKIFHNSDAKLDDRYKFKFEIHWEEEPEEGQIKEMQFHMPTASAMRFVDYVKELAKNGFGIGQVVTRLSISRQIQKNSQNRYSRAEFTMVGTVDAEGNITEVQNGITTVNKK